MFRLALITLFFFTYLCKAQQYYGDSIYRQIVASEKKAFQAKQTTSQNVAANTYNVVHARCEWNIDPAVRFISGNVTTRFIPLVPNFSSMQFDLSTAMKVDSIKYHAAKLSFSHQSQVLSVSLPSVVTMATLDSICIYYHGAPQASFYQGLHAGEPVIWTLSEPFGPKDWWPCKQNLSDKIDSLDIIVTTVASNKVASLGLLLSETVNGNRKTCHWKTRYPTAPYLVAIASTNYEAHTEQVSTPNGTVQILNYVYPETAAQSFQTSGVAEIMKLFDSLTIAYPFSNEKYGHAQFNGSGGMEHQTMSFIWGFDYSLMAHEAAHQWFGDHITCGSWQDIWLNESFATYFEGLCIQRYRPQFWRSWRQGRITDIASQPGGSVLCDDTTSASRILDSRLTYNKGALLLHMLRWQLGDSAFFAAIKNYLNDPKLKRGFAKTPDLVKHFEAAGKQNLGTFFNQWYYKQGYPSYTVNWSQEGDIVTFKIDQSQSHPSVPFFEMPVQLKIIGRNNDTLVRFRHQFSGQTFTVKLAYQATDVNFDPDLWLLSSNNKVLNLNEKSLTDVQLKVYPNPGSDHLMIEGFAQGVKPSQVALFDDLGKPVLIQTDFTVFTGQLHLQVGTLESSAYTLLITTNAGQKKIRFIKK